MVLENVETLVKNVASAYCNKIQETLVANVEQKHQEMLLNIKKVLLPRPAALGPFSKMKAKSLVVPPKKSSINFTES